MYQEFSANQQPHQQQGGMGFGGDIYGNQQASSTNNPMMMGGNHNSNGFGVGPQPPAIATATQGRSSNSFLLITFVNVICVPMCFAGTFTSQMVSTTHADFSQEISIYFNHYEIFISNMGALPNCLGDKYSPGTAMGVIAGVCSILALLSGVIIACYQVKSPLRFARTAFAGVACVFAIVATGISKSGFGACDGGFDTYKSGPGGALLIVAIILTAIVAGASLARELLCPEMLCVSRSQQPMTLQRQQMMMMQQISAQQQQLLHSGAGGPGGFPNQPQYPMQPGGFPQQQQAGGFGMQPYSNNMGAYGQQHHTLGMGGFQGQAATSTIPQESFGL